MKKSVACLSFFVFPVLLQAQNLNNNQNESGWFIGADAGVNVVVAENFLGNFPYSALQGTGGTYRLQAGYRLTPVFSVRSVAGFASSRWYNKKNSSVAFNSEYAAVDVKLDLLKFYSEYKTGKRFSAGLFSGAGFIFRNKITNSAKFITTSDPVFIPLLRAGGTLDYQISNSLIFFINAELNFTGDRLNGYEAGKRSFDILPCLTVGLMYDFSPKMRGHWEF